MPTSIVDQAAPEVSLRSDEDLPIPIPPGEEPPPPIQEPPDKPVVGPEGPVREPGPRELRRLSRQGSQPRFSTHFDMPGMVPFATHL